MKIKNLKIKNYRNLKDISLDFNDLTILIGKNDAGKSNILKALDLFFKWDESIDWKEISVGGGGNPYEYLMNMSDYRLFFDQKPKTIELVANVELNSKEVDELFPDSLIKISGQVEHLSKEGFGGSIAISKQIVGEEDKKAIFKINSIIMGDLILYRKDDKKHFARKANGVYNFGGNGEDISLKCLNLIKNKFLLVPAVRDIKKEGRIGNLASLNGEFVPNEFLRFEKNISLDKKPIFNQINSDLSKIFPEYQTVASMEDSKNQIETYFGPFPSASIGSGVKQQFINIFNINSYKNVVLGIEEPEIHLHPKAQRKVFNFLKEKSKEKQIIITTHSPIFTSSSDLINLYLIKKQTNNEAEINYIQKSEEFQSIKSELGSKNADLFSYDSIWLVEGDSEEIFFPSIAEKKGVNMREKGIKIINIRGKDSVRRSKIQEYLQYLKDTGIKCFVILDKDANVEDYLGDLKRARLLEEGNSHLWSKGDFEDCFSEEDIIKTMSNLLGEEFTLEKEKMKEDRKEKKTTEILSQFLYDNNLGNLNKPALAEELAKLVGKEDKTEPEKIFRKFIDS